MRLGAVRLAFLLTLAIAGLAAWSPVGLAERSSATRVDVARVQSLPCTRAGMAEAVMAFLGLLNEKRFDATRLIWLPKRGRTPGFFWMGGHGRYLRVTRGRQIPGVTRRWFAVGGTVAELIRIDPRVRLDDPSASGFGFDWIRGSADDGTLVLGSGKGGWDCEKRRISMFGGSERPVASVDEARAGAAGQCGRGYRIFRRYGQSAFLCRLPRGASS